MQLLRLRHETECDTCGECMVESQQVIRHNRQLFCSAYCHSINSEQAETMFDSGATGARWDEQPNH